MILEVLSVTLFIILSICIFTIVNLMKKLEAHEDILEIQDEYLLNISTTIIEGKKHIDMLDQKGIFQADDEVGVFFDAIKVIQENLNLYIKDVDNAQEKN